MNDYSRLGMVNRHRHRDLLKPDGQCIGSGYCYSGCVSDRTVPGVDTALTVRSGIYPIRSVPRIIAGICMVTAYTMISGEFH